MKLYATVASERATKGQGGNDFLDVRFYGEGQIYLGMVSLVPLDEHNKGVYRLMYTSWAGEVNLISVMRTEKGNKKKDECENKDANGNACYNCESGQGGPCGSAQE